MKCNSCNFENNINAKFCSNCGKSLTNERKKINILVLFILFLVTLYFAYIFVYPYFFSKELYRVKVGDKYGFIDNKGNMVIKPIFSDVKDFSEGYAVIELSDYKVGIIDKFGKITFPISKNIYTYNVNYIGDCKNGRFKVRDKDNNYGFINTNGEIVVKLIYKNINNFSDKRARFKKNGKYGFIKTDGSILIKPKLYFATDFKEGIARVKRTDKDGYIFINVEGKKISYPEYYNAEDFSNGLAVAQKEKDDKYGYINKEGDWEISPKFYEANSFVDGIAKVKINKEDDYIYIDLKGNEINK